MNDAGRAYMNLGIYRENSPVEDLLTIEDGFYAYLDAAINFIGQSYRSAHSIGS